MTDKEIIDGLKKLVKCQKAEIKGLQKDGETITIALLKARVEVEALKSDVDFLNKHNDELIARVDKLMPYGTQVEVSKKIEKEIKSEAIKEFAKRLKEKSWQGMWEIIPHVDVDDIDNLVKEMTEDEGK